MIFSTPEREFLRLSAMSSPDWPAMITIARTALHYGELRRLALLHQLDGVVAWRLLDDRMDGVAPNIVRDDCQRQLDNLAWANGKWWAEAVDFCERLDAAGISYTMRGGPAQYACLGIPAWPRSWSDIDLFVPITSEAAVQKIAADMGGTYTRWFAAWWSVSLPSELRFDCEVCPNEEVSWDMFAGARDVSVLGATQHIPSAEAWVAHWAWNTWKTVSRHATPLPLWALARIKGVIDNASGWSWENFGALLRANIATIVAHADMPASWRAEDVHERNVPAYYILQLLSIVDRVYGLFPPDITIGTLIAPHELRTPPIITEGEYRVHDQPYEMQFRLLEWGTWPGDEAFLFDYYERTGTQARLAAGLWRETGKHDKAGVSYDPVQHRNVVRAHPDQSEKPDAS